MPMSFGLNALALGLLVAEMVVDLLFVRANGARERGGAETNRYLLILIALLTLNEAVAAVVMYESSPSRLFQGLVMCILYFNFFRLYRRTPAGTKNPYMWQMYFVAFLTAMSIADQVWNMLHIANGGITPVHSAGKK